MEELDLSVDCLAFSIVFYLACSRKLSCRAWYFKGSVSDENWHEDGVEAGRQTAAAMIFFSQWIPQQCSLKRRSSCNFWWFLRTNAISCQKTSSQILLNRGKRLWGSALQIASFNPIASNKIEERKSLFPWIQSQIDKSQTLPSYSMASSLNGLSTYVLLQ